MSPKTTVAAAESNRFSSLLLGPMHTDISNAVIEALRKARRTVVLTGAGVSAESGIPTFRDALTGLWSNYNAEDLATPEAFQRDPALVTRWYDERRLRCLDCRPNVGHIALTELQRHFRSSGRSLTIITQNVDRLHQTAGTDDVIELHGSLFEWRCTRTGAQQEYRGAAFAEYPPQSADGGILRPGVVWFGEPLPESAVMRADAAVGACDLFLSIGTSAVVYPAAGYIHLAQANGAITIEINRDATPISRLVDYSWRGKFGEILPDVVRRLQAE